MLGARRAALAAAARLARQARCFSAVSRTVYPQQDAPAVQFSKQGELSFSRSFAAAAEPAPAPTASKGSVKTVGMPPTHCFSKPYLHLAADPLMRWHAPSCARHTCPRTIRWILKTFMRGCVWRAGEMIDIADAISL